MKAALKIPKSLDFQRLGLKVGLEIHQQLETSRKLFCECPPITVSHEELAKAPRIRRELRVAKSELGEIDVAAAFEVQRGRVFEYIAPPSASCLVELDEEPPHEMSREALVIGLAIALALHAKPVDEVHVMRKIVVDGSNTTGFQRTAIIAMNGYVDTSFGKVGIQTVTLEEDAARKIEEHDNVVVYALDRLGIPLVEISTAPDIHSPEQAKEVAETIGILMRLTGKVKRGLGTIRQDINLSISGSPKIEIKGVQRLELLPKVIANEARRLYGLLMIRDELRRRNVKPNDVMSQKPVDVTDLLRDCGSRIVRSALQRGERVYALERPKFDGILGIELQEGRRFGTELADYVKQWTGLKGLIHSDELPAYGITEDYVQAIRDRLEMGNLDAFVIVIGPTNKVLRALDIVKERAAYAVIGIPKETRAANDDGTTRYMRPQPGAARMYPETDIPPIVVTDELLNEARKLVPPPPTEELTKLVNTYGLSRDLAKQILLSGYLRVFEDLAKECRSFSPSMIASVFTSVAGELRKLGIELSEIPDAVIREVILVADSMNLGKDGLVALLMEVGKRGVKIPEKVRELVEALGIKPLDLESVRKEVEEVINNHMNEIMARGERAFSFVMGKVMSRLRGRVDGKLVAKIVMEELSKIFKG